LGTDDEPKTGSLRRKAEVHTEVITSLGWLPDNSGFFSGSLDGRIILWDKDGNERNLWDFSPARIIQAVPITDQLWSMGMQFMAPMVLPGTTGITSRKTYQQLAIYNVTTRAMER
jgi:WD repeat-containing protein 26